MADGFNPQEFGEKLRALRGRRSLDEIASMSGVLPHVLVRYEKGQTDKPAFQHMIWLANTYHITPNTMAALADLYVLPGEEQAQLGDDASMLRSLENDLLTFTEDERKIVLGTLAAAVDNVKRLKYGRVVEYGGDKTVLPDWFLRQVNR